MCKWIQGKYIFMRSGYSFNYSQCKLYRSVIFFEFWRHSQQYSRFKSQHQFIANQLLPLLVNSMLISQPLLLLFNSHFSTIFLLLSLLPPLSLALLHSLPLSLLLSLPLSLSLSLSLSLFHYTTFAIPLSHPISLPLSLRDGSTNVQLEHLHRAAIKMVYHLIYLHN